MEIQWGSLSEQPLCCSISPPPKDAPKFSCRQPQPTSYPGAPRSWHPLWAIGSSASLQFTQREMLSF